MAENHLINEVELNNNIEKNQFSGVITVLHKGKQIYTSVSGFADRSNRLPNKVDTRFGIASGTKFLTALAIGLLIDAKKLNLSNKVFDIIKIRDRFPSYSAEVTIENLLNHTSGLPDYFDENLVDDANNFKVAVPWNELTRPCHYFQVFPQKSMKFNPGTEFSYSNSGYVLLAATVEEITGQRYTDFVTNEILHKNEMLDSGFFPLNQLPENTALGYIETAAGWHTNIYNLPIIGGGDGGAFSTAANLLNLWRAFYSNQILSKELTERYLAAKVATNKKQLFYGYGVWISKTAQSKLDYITGCDAGVSFQSGVIESKDIIYTVLSNTTDGAWPVLRVLKPMLL